MIPDVITKAISDNRQFIIWFCIGIALCFLIGLFFPHSSAYDMVMQGQNVSQGKMYDLSGVYSWGEYQGQFVYWKNWWEEGGSVEPDYIITVEPRFAYSVYIDPTTWREGNWFKRCSNCKNENNFAFKVVKGNSTMNVTPVVTATPKVAVVLTAVATQPAPTEVPTTIKPVATPRTPAPTTTVPTPVPTPTFPKPGLPLSTPIIVAGVVIGAFLFTHYRLRG